MTTTKKLFAALAFASAAVLGSRAGATEELAGAPAPSAESGFISFEIAAQDDCATVLVADVAPWLDGRSIVVSFGPEAGMGGMVGAAQLHAGQNTIVVPNFPEAGWYTGAIDGTARTVREAEEWGLE